MTRDNMPRPTRFGRYAVPERPSLRTLHLFRGEVLKEVNWTSPVPVLDQEDLIEQDIYCATFIPGAENVDALGSCTCNAATRHLGERLTAAGKPLGDAVVASQLGPKLALSDNSKNAEEFAIALYHQVTDQSGSTSTEWPPTDCGSTELFVAEYLEKLGVIGGHKTASNIEGALSLLQAGSVPIGGPFFNAWMTPDSDGFIDGDGSAEALEAAINSGVAGGHETVLHQICQLAQASNGVVALQQTILEVWNSWSPAWGLGGSYRIHASTLHLLGSNVDFKQFVVAS